MRRSVVMVDGQHYPTVVERTVAAIEASGDEVVGAVFLGGTEKTEHPPELGVPTEVGGPEALARIISAVEPDVVIDLSDEPVLDHRRRFELIGVALGAGVAYEGAGYRMTPPVRPSVAEVRTVAVTGTGKRTGKTAMAIELARFWRDQGRRPCIVTMGRGGPPDPILLRAGDFRPTPAGLVDLSKAGLHAASDYIEDAVFAGVDTVGTFRCGAGFSGATDWHNFLAGVRLAESTDPGMLLLEGSGTAIPPVAADASLLVISASIDPEFLRGYLGPFRLADADAAVVVGGSGEPAGPEALTATIRSVRRDLPVFVASYEAEPSTDVADRAVLVATTAPEIASPEITNQLMARGASVVDVVHSLSDRAVLREDLEQNHQRRPPDLALVEVKAAAVDVVVPWAERLGIDVGFLHNRVVVPGGTELVAEVLDRSAG